EHSGLPAGRYPRAAAGDSDVHRMVLLGVPRQGAQRDRLRLNSVMLTAKQSRDPISAILAELACEIGEWSATHRTSARSEANRDRRRLAGIAAAHAQRHADVEIVLIDRRNFRRGDCSD